MSVEIVDRSGVACLSWTPRADAPPAERNFGDDIGGLVVDAMLRRAGVAKAHVPDPSKRLLTVGSVLHFAESRDTVWGSGINGKIRRQSLPLDLDVRAVRGPLTRSVLLSRGIRVPRVFGDPALLLPRLMPEYVQTRDRAGVLFVPNINEIDEWDATSGMSPLGPPGPIIERIAGAEFVVATSLHALIVADALGVPNRPIAPVRESTFKYVDHYLATGRPDVVFAHSIQEALDLGPVARPEIDLDALGAAFPLDLWGPGEGATGPGPVSFLDLARAGDAQRRESISSMQWKVTPEAAEALVRVDQLESWHLPTDGVTREEAEALGLDLAHLRSRATRPDLLLSVIVPTHNVGPWVVETLQSICRQAIEAMEIIVVDDHSEDETVAKVSRLAEVDHRIRLVRSVSRGGGVARNIGLDHARGQYLAFCDGDDIVPDGSYAAMLGSLEDSGSDIVFGDYLKFSPTDTWRPTENMRSYSRAGTRRTIVQEPELLYSRPCWNKLFRRGFWESSGIRFPNVPRSNDIVPMVSAYVKARRVDIVPDVVYLYRERPGVTSMTARSGGGASFLSYLSQETECARLIRTVHNAGLERVFSGLVYDRDTYVHTVKYLSSWQPSPEDEDVAAALTRLLAATPPPARWTPPEKVLALRLAAGGDMAAARAMSLITDDRVVGEERVDAWIGLLRSPLFRNDEQARYPALVSRLEGDLLGLQAVDGEGWLRLAGAVAASHMAPWVRGVPELAASPTPTLLDQIADAHMTLGARLTAIEGGLELIVRGVVNVATAMVPVLFDAQEPETDYVRPRSITWVTTQTGLYEWTATFDARSVPIDHAMRPVLADSLRRIALAIPGEFDLPRYNAFDSFLYDVHGGVIIRRRQHWTRRSARRAYRIAKDRIRSR